MTINSVLATGVQGIHTGVAQANRAAGDIARMATGDDTVDLATSLVALKSGETQVKAAAKVVESADEAIGTLIDIRA